MDCSQITSGLSCRPIVVASHPRSGTHFTIDLLRRQFADCHGWKWPGERNDRLYCNIDELFGRDGILSPIAARRILSRSPRPIIKTHAWPGLCQGFFPQHAGVSDESLLRWLKERATWVYVWRDVRPVMCSYYEFCLGDGSIGPDVTIHEFIRQRIDGVTRVGRWADHVGAWMGETDASFLNFDELRRNPRENLERLSSAFGMPALYQDPLLPQAFASLWHSRRARLFSLRPESTAIINRKKLDWKQELTADDLEFIQDELRTVKRPAQMDAMVRFS